MCIPCIRGSHWVDKKYEFMIPIFNYQAPTKEVLKVPLMVQERIKKDEEGPGPAKAKSKKPTVAKQAKPEQDKPDTGK